MVKSRAMTPDEVVAFVEKMRAMGATSVRVGEVAVEFRAAPRPTPEVPPRQQEVMDDMERAERERAARDAVEFWSAPGSV